MIDAIIEIATFLTSFALDLFRWLGAFWTALVGTAIALFSGGMEFILNLLCDYIVLTLEYIQVQLVLANITIPNPVGDVTIAVEYLRVIDYYFPTFEAGVALAQWVALAIVVWGVRFVIKIIPTIG